MKYNRVTPEIINHLCRILPEQYVFTDTGSLQRYSRDETEDLSFLPEAVVKPGTPQEISEIVRLCNRELIPVTPRGGGTGLSGGALPVCGGLILSMERLNRIIEIDERNLQATVEPGVITEVFQNTLKEKGLFYPPDPASRGSCFLGGNIAENAGGPKAVKYGVTRDYVLNLEVVLPTGEIIWTGANTLKNSTGYNLTQLMVGCEGTLGMVTKIVFKLIPHPPFDLLMFVPFQSAEDACSAVFAIFRAGIAPSALEFMERDAFDFAFRYLGEEPVKIEKDTAAALLIEVDGNNMEILRQDCEKIAEVLEYFSCGDMLLADTSEHKERIWKVRRCLGLAVKGTTIYKEEDTVVPRAELPTLLKGVKEIEKKYGFHSVCYGHAGDGNLHVNIIKGDTSDAIWENKLPEGIREIFQLVVRLGGTISGEHGIGWVQKPYLNIAIDATRLRLMKEVKRVFDPNNILNPDKIF